MLEHAQRELLALPGAGASILEISHRSAAFGRVLESAQQRLIELLGIPENYKIIFLQGGSRLQFSMIPMNLLRGSKAAADYLVTGSWSIKALDEARKELHSTPRGSLPWQPRRPLRQDYEYERHGTASLFV